MIFWLLVLVMLLAGAMFVLAPMVFARAPAKVEPVTPTVVFRDQLLEIERKQLAGEGDAELLAAERVEVARRLLASEDEVEEPAGRNAGRSLAVASLASIVAIPALVLPAYLALGSPGRPDAPLSATQNVDLANTDIATMVLVAERHLSKNPNDLRGWKVLADTYGRMNRPGQRARALERVASLGENTPFVKVELGEALTVAANNIVPPRARTLFLQALENDPNNPKASLYMALSMEQNGDTAGALKRWTELQATRKDDVRFQQLVGASLVRLNAKRDTAEVAALPADQRSSMIENMVEGLADRLEDDADDFEGWARLIRSYAVLNRLDDARRALATARETFAGQAGRLGNLNDLAKALNLTDTTQKVN